MRHTHCTQLIDPITGVPTLFVDPRDGGKRTAEIYLELALKYHVTFKEITRMAMVKLRGPEAWEEGFDDRKLHRIMQDLLFEAECAHGLMSNFKLPLGELVKIWLKGREVLLRFANRFPKKREEVQALLAEQEATMIALLERGEKGRGNDGGM